MVMPTRSFGRVGVVEEGFCVRRTANAPPMGLVERLSQPGQSISVVGTRPFCAPCSRLSYFPSTCSLSPTFVSLASSAPAGSSMTAKARHDTAMRRGGTA